MPNHALRHALLHNLRLHGAQLLMTHTQEAMKGGLRDEAVRLCQLDSALGSMRRRDVMRARFRQLVSPCGLPDV